MIKKFFKEFEEFAMRGNLVDMAVGIVVGAAFGKITTSFVNDVLMPPIGLFLGEVDFSSLFWSLNGRRYPSIAEAKAAGAPTLNYGLFINTILDFMIVALAVFLLVRQINRLKREPEAAKTPEKKDCPYCFSAIPNQAIRCPQCTSDLKA